MMAQTDTLGISAEEDDESIEYLSPLEYAFMMHEETPWMFKLSLPIPGGSSYRTISSINDNRFNTGSVLGLFFERKIGKDWSIDMGASYLGTANDISYFDLKIAPRWYYQMRKKIKEGKSGNHLSGNYFSTGLVYQRNTVSANWLTFFGEWGFQRRYLANGFLDFGLRAGYSNPLDSGTEGSFTLGSNVNIGIAFAKDRQGLDDSRLCDVFKCYEAERRLFKVNIFQLFNSIFIDDVQSIRSTIELGYEEKIGNSPFSIAAHIAGTFSRSKNQDFFRTRGFTLTTRIGPRYYYNLKRQIAKGNSGNGLSANYFALEFITDHASFTLINQDQKVKGNGSQVAGDFLVGFQRTIGDHLYYDVSLGIGLSDDRNDDLEDLQVRLPINLGIGFRL
jgi:hypothetical protein